MKKAILVVLFCLGFGFSFGQANGDYRSRVDGNWSTVSTWEVFNNGWRILSSIEAGPFRNILPTNSSGEITIRHTVSIAVTVTANQIVIPANGRLNIFSGRTLIIADDFTNTPLLIEADGILAITGTLDLQSSLTSTPCQIFGRLVSVGSILVTNPALLVFNANSIYQHAHKSGGDIPLANWNLNSLCYITGLSGNPALPNNLNQTFGNFLWNTPSLTVSSFSLDGQLTTVNGNLRFLNCGTSQVKLDTNGPGTNLTVGGNLILDGIHADLVLSQSQTTTTNLTIGGNIIHSAGDLTFGVSNNQPINIFLSGDFQKTGGFVFRGSGTGVGTMRFNGTTQSFTSDGLVLGAVHYVIANGSTVNLGTSALTGTGTLNVNSGGTLTVGSTDAGGAIQSSASNGNIRVSGSRTYQAGSTIVYNGSAAQFIGTGHPPIPNTTIDNVNNVTLVGNVTINGALSQPEGILNIASNTLTLGGAYSRINGYFGITTLSNLIINGTGDFGDLILSPQQFTDNPMRNLIINRTGGTVFLGNSLIVGGVFSQSNGNFSLGEFSAYTLTLRGNFIQSGGALLTYGGSGLVIEGTGTLPANVNIVGPDLSTLTMNRVGDFVTSSSLTIGNLNLFNGQVSNPTFSISMAPDGLVTRQSGGTILNALGAISSFDVLYDVTTDIETGNELPFTSPVTTRLGNLTKQGVATVTLNHEIVVNKSFNIIQGTFDIGSNNHVGIGEDLIVGGTLLSGESRVSFLGSSPQQIDAASPLTLFDVEVNQTVPSTVSLSATTLLDIQNSLAVNSGSSVLNAGTNQLRLLSTSTRTANVNQLASGATIVGSVIVQRFLPKVVARRDHFYMASPVVGTTLADWDVELPLGRSYRWNEPTHAWVQISSGTVLTNGRGFLVDVATTGTATYDSRGTLAQHNISVPLTIQSPLVDGFQGLHLIGNPYPSAIDWDNVAVPVGLNNAIYFRDNFGNSGQGSEEGILVSYVDGIGTPGGYSGTIAQGQAFFVQATSNTTIQFTEAAKITPTNTQFFRKAEIPNVLRIMLKGNDGRDEAVIRLREGATEKFDSRFDAQKVFKEKMSISTLTADNVSAAINALGTSDCNKVIPLLTEGIQPGSYTLGFVGMESFDSFIKISLLDLVEKTSVDIKKQNAYSFIVRENEVASTSSRFQISIDVNGSNSNAVSLSFNDGTLTSSSEMGNQWFLNGELLTQETGTTLEVLQGGQYTVIVTEGGCSQSASLEVTGQEGEVAISVFPNPTYDKVYIRMKSANNNVTATLVNTQGMELDTNRFEGEGSNKATEFDLGTYATGIYNVRIVDGDKVIIKKIAKVK